MSWSKNTHTSETGQSEIKYKSEVRTFFKWLYINLTNILLKIRGVKPNVTDNSEKFSLTRRWKQLFHTRQAKTALSEQICTIAMGKHPKQGGSLSPSTNMLLPVWRGDRWRSLKWWARRWRPRKQQRLARKNGADQPRGRENMTFDRWAVIVLLFYFCCWWKPVKTPAVGWLTYTVKQLQALVHQNSSYFSRFWQEYTPAAGSQPATRALCSPDIWDSNGVGGATIPPNVTPSFRDLMTVRESSTITPIAFWYCGLGLFYLNFTYTRRIE